MTRRRTMLCRRVGASGVVALSAKTKLGPSAVTSPEFPSHANNCRLDFLTFENPPFSSGHGDSFGRQKGTSCSLISCFLSHLIRHSRLCSASCRWTRALTLSRSASTKLPASLVCRWTTNPLTRSQSRLRSQPHRPPHTLRA